MRGCVRGGECEGVSWGCGRGFVCPLYSLCRLSELCRNLESCKLASDSNKSLVNSVHLKVSGCHGYAIASSEHVHMDCCHCSMRSW